MDMDMDIMDMDMDIMDMDMGMDRMDNMDRTWKWTNYAQPQTLSEHQEGVRQQVLRFGRHRDVLERPRGRAIDGHRSWMGICIRVHTYEHLPSHRTESKRIHL